MTAFFPSVQVYIKRYDTSHRLDEDINGGGFLFYIREDIPSSSLNSEILIDSLFVELNIRKKI